MVFDFWEPAFQVRQDSQESQKCLTEEIMLGELVLTVPGCIRVSLQRVQGCHGRFFSRENQQTQLLEWKHCSGGMLNPAPAKQIATLGSSVPHILPTDGVLRALGPMPRKEIAPPSSTASAVFLPFFGSFAM